MNKKKSFVVWEWVHDSANSLLLVVVTLLVVGLLILALVVAKTWTFRPQSKPVPAPRTATGELPPLPVTITKPHQDETVSGLVPVTLINPSRRNFQKLEFWVDKQVEKKFDAAGANLSDKLYEVKYNLDSRKYADGRHVLTVMAIDMEGRYQSFGVEVNFANRQALKSQ